MTDSWIVRRTRVLPVVLALLAAGLLATIVLLGAPATSSAAPPTYTCTTPTRTFFNIAPKMKSALEKIGATCTKNS